MSFSVLKTQLFYCVLISDSIMLVILHQPYQKEYVYLLVIISQVSHIITFVETKFYFFIVVHFCISQRFQCSIYRKKHDYFFFFKLIWQQNIIIFFVIDTFTHNLLLSEEAIPLHKIVIAYFHYQQQQKKKKKILWFSLFFVSCCLYDFANFFLYCSTKLKNNSIPYVTNLFI